MNGTVHKVAFLVEVGAPKVEISKKALRELAKAKADPQFRSDLAKAFKAFFMHQLESGVYDEALQAGADKFCALQKGDGLVIRIGIHTIYNDSIFMPLLWKEAKLKRRAKP